MVRTLATLASIAILLLSACTKKGADSSNAEPPKELRLFTWSEYFDEEFLREFGKKNGITVKADYFSSNEEMLAKLQLAGSESYDLILPSDYMIRTLIDLKMLKAIDKAQLPVLKDFEPAALNPDYDPNLQFSVPLAIGTTGIVVNTKLLPAFADASRRAKGITWKEMLENPAYKGKITLLDDVKEVTQIALSLQGKQLATATEKDVKEAFAYLRTRKSQIKGFPPETRPVIEADECSLCMAYSGDALSVAKEKKEIYFLVPTDDTVIWTDNLAIPEKSKNPGMAYKLINELLSPEGSKAFTIRTGYRTANLKAMQLLPKEITENRVIFPTAEDRKRMHFIVQRKDLALVIDREWALLKSQ